MRRSPWGGVAVHIVRGTTENPTILLSVVDAGDAVREVAPAAGGRRHRAERSTLVEGRWRGERHEHRVGIDDRDRISAQHRNYVAGAVREPAPVPVRPALVRVGGAHAEKRLARARVGHRDRRPRILRPREGSRQVRRDPQRLALLARDVAAIGRESPGAGRTAQGVPVPVEVERVSAVGTGVPGSRRIVPVDADAGGVVRAVPGACGK